MWASDTVDNPGAFVVVQDDANVVVYRADNVVLWTSAGNEQEPNGSPRSSDLHSSRSGDSLNRVADNTDVALPGTNMC